ncbi:hypothetical protein, partial [Flavobacterium sp. LB3R33]|uniref:hypothetical protein n=1 Tax=Flavobacterium sp. LB3R33 TaxID=3401721 RepID=UPI003AAD8FA8
KENNFVFIVDIYYFKLSIELIYKNPAGRLDKFPQGLLFIIIGAKDIIFIIPEDFLSSGIRLIILLSINIRLFYW